MSFIRTELVKQIDQLANEKKTRLGVTTLRFEKSDESYLNGAVRIGYYVSFINKNGGITISEWHEVDPMILIRIKDRLRSNKFYGEKRVKGQMCKVRLKG